MPHLKLTISGAHRGKRVGGRGEHDPTVVDVGDPAVGEPSVVAVNLEHVAYQEIERSNQRRPAMRARPPRSRPAAAERQMLANCENARPRPPLASTPPPRSPVPARPPCDLHLRAHHARLRPT